MLFVLSTEKLFNFMVKEDSSYVSCLLGGGGGGGGGGLPHKKMGLLVKNLEKKNAMMYQEPVLWTWLEICFHPLELPILKQPLTDTFIIFNGKGSMSSLVLFIWESPPGFLGLS